LDTFPRETWESHYNFDQLLRFWLDRHLMFRRLLETLRTLTETHMDARLGFETFAPRLGQLGSTFLGELHTHHTMEDTHYFPKLVQLDARIAHGFDLLDADHHALDARMQAFADTANAVLKGGEPGPLQDAILSFERLMDRHLTDEEELVVPLLLKHGPQGVI
jgi:hemerythrin-like domain-containing protein